LFELRVVSDLSADLPLEVLMPDGVAVAYVCLWLFLVGPAA
jgi:hypothetical protein